MLDLAAEMLVHTRAIELETKGFLPSAEWNDLVHKEICPRAAAAVFGVASVVPIVMSVDAEERPCRFPGSTRYTRLGLAVSFGSSVLFAWTSGMVGAKTHSALLTLESVLSVSPFEHGPVSGVDIGIGAATWSILFTERLPPALTQRYRQELVSRLSSKGHSAAKSPGAAVAQRSFAVSSPLGPDARPQVSLRKTASTDSPSTILAAPEARQGLLDQQRSIAAGPPNPLPSMSVPIQPASPDQQAAPSPGPAGVRFPRDDSVSPSSASPRSGGKRVLWWSGGVAVLAVCGVVLWAILRPSSTDSAVDAARASAEPVASQLPAVTDGGPTLAYLAGSGGSLITGLHTQSIAQLASESPTTEECRQRARDLDSVLPAETSVDVIDAVPDSVLRESFNSERLALGLALTRCVTGPAAGPVAKPGVMNLSEAVGLVDLRLDALGYRR